MWYIFWLCNRNSTPKSHFLTRRTAKSTTSVSAELNIFSVRESHTISEKDYPFTVGRVSNFTVRPSVKTSVRIRGKGNTRIPVVTVLETYIYYLTIENVFKGNGISSVVTEMINASIHLVESNNVSDVVFINNPNVCAKRTIF